MVGTIFLALVVGLLGGIIGALAAPRIQATYLRHTPLAGEDREKMQDKRITDIEMRFTTQVQQLLQAWHTWESKDDLRFEELKQQHEAEQAQLALEREIARVPLIDEIPLSLLYEDKNGHASTNWQPARLEGAELTNRDFSRRFLRRANLRKAKLINVNFFMADLSGADLSGATLCGSDLSGANLNGADLRNTNLSGANLRVADLQNARLANATMQEARNLTSEQVQSAFTAEPIPQQTAFDVDMITPRAPSIFLPDSSIPEQTTDLAVSSQEAIETGEQGGAPIFGQSDTEQETLANVQLTVTGAEGENVAHADEENAGASDQVTPDELWNENAAQGDMQKIEPDSTQIFQFTDSDVVDTFLSSGASEPTHVSDLSNGASEFAHASEDAIFDNLPVTPAPSESQLPLVENIDFEAEPAAEPSLEPSPDADAAPAPEFPAQQTEPMQRVAPTANMIGAASTQRKRKHSGSMRGRR